MKTESSPAGAKQVFSFASRARSGHAGRIALGQLMQLACISAGATPKKAPGGISGADGVVAPLGSPGKSARRLSVLHVVTSELCRS